MRIDLHLCAPPGEATRRIITRVLNVCKDDNRIIIGALLDQGAEVPDTVWELGLVYNPTKPNSTTQPFYSLADMVARGEFSCGDAAAYEAAVLEEKYGVPTEVMCVPQGRNEYHAIYVCPRGAIDPTENWLRQVQGQKRKQVTGANRW